MSIRERSADTEVKPGKHSLSRMRFSDLPQVLGIERSSFSDPWPEFAFLRAVSSRSCYATVAKQEETVVGYLIGYINESELHIANVAISPQYRRKGIARELLIDAMTTPELTCHYAILDVRESNNAAITLYRSLGFRSVGRRTAYYRRPVEDALVMKVDLRRGP